MSTQHWKGATVPGAGDDLLAALPTMLDTAGVVTTASSVAAARTMLTAATAAGATVTTTAPAFFDVQGVLYRADGTKSSGVWVLRPVNEEEVETTPSTAFENAGTTLTLGKSQQWALATSQLPIRPYDRRVTVWGIASAVITAGDFFLRALINDVGGADGKWESGAAETSVMSMNMGVIKAGTAPNIVMAVRSGTASSTNTIYVSNQGSLNRLIVTAKPVSMA